MLDSLYKRGMAGGLPEIKSDRIVFRFRDEVFEFDSYFILNKEIGGKRVIRLIRKQADYSGICYVAPVKVLRKLKNEQERKNG